VRNAVVRIARLLVRRCAFRAVFARLTAAQRRQRMAAVRAPGFKGLVADEAELCVQYKYSTHAELVQACKDDGWILGGYREDDDGAWDDWVLSSPLLPHIDFATGAFDFSKSFNLERFCQQLTATRIALAPPPSSIHRCTLVRTGAEVRGSARNDAAAVFTLTQVDESASAV